MQHLKQGELAIIETVWGHMAGGGLNEDDTHWMNDKIARFIGAQPSLVGKFKDSKLE